MACVKHHAVPWLQRPLQPHPDTLALHPRYVPEEHAALLAEPAMNELLVVRAPEPAGIKAARERHLHLVVVVTRYPRLAGQSNFGQRSSRRKEALIHFGLR